jgi:succinate dehydrogenase / fumarate reductase cytochrome b subunit
MKSNYLGVRGWAWAGKYKLERYLYLLHRITGLGLILYVLIHLTVTTVFRLQGQDFFEAVMRSFHHPVFKFGEFLVLFAFVIHALNGLRLILQESGFLMGRPTPPIYPFKDALRRKRPVVLGMIALVVVLAAAVLFDFVMGGP